MTERCSFALLEGRPVGTKLILGGLRAKRGKMGVRGLPAGKIFQDHALFIAGNALSVQITQFKLC